jgi:hypothetical protein
MSQKIPPHFLSTGISAISNKKTTSIQELPKHAALLFPAQDKVIPALQYDQTPPTVQYRALKNLAPDLKDTPEILSPNHYYAIAESIKNNLDHSSPEWRALANDPKTADLFNDFRNIIEDDLKNRDILTNGLNALKPA